MMSRHLQSGADRSSLIVDGSVERNLNKPGGDDGSRALLNNATIVTIELVEAFEEALT